MRERESVREIDEKFGRGGLYIRSYNKLLFNYNKDEESFVFLNATFLFYFFIAISFFNQKRKSQASI